MLVPSLIGEIRNSVNNYSSELFSLKLKAVNIRKSVCNLDDVIGMVQTSTQIQEQKAEALEAFSQKTEEFTAEAARIDEDAAAVVVGICVVSMISNGLYSIGSIYNGIKGIGNAALREYSKSWIRNASFRNAISGAGKFPFSLQPDTSTFWSGIGDKGMNNGDLIAANCADKMGRSTLETTLVSHKINMPQWNPSDPSTIRAWQSASSSYAMHSSGNVTALLGNNVRPTSVWNVFEKVILNVNSGVSSITTYTTTGVNIYERTIQWGSVLLGGTNAFGQSASVLNGDD